MKLDSSLLKLLKVKNKNLAYYLVVAGLIIFFAYHNNTVQTAIGNSQPGTYAVESFSDGDTVTVDMNGTEETIRFIGVDTPETHHPSKPVQCFGRAASVFTKDLIGDQRIRLGADSESDNRDRYNRLLRYVYLPDGTNVNKQIIAQGYGFAYRSFPHSMQTEFIAAEEVARKQKLGLWGGCDLEVNDYGTYQTAPDKAQ